MALGCRSGGLSLAAGESAGANDASKELLPDLTTSQVNFFPKPLLRREIRERADKPGEDGTAEAQ
jgi:hypothetical protein